MNDHDPLDRYMNDFGRRLEAATAVPRRRRPRVLLLAAPAVGAALVLTALLLLLPGGSTTRRLDVVAEARAALQPQDGALTHMVVAEHVETPPGAHRDRVFGLPFTGEQWSATDPVRWRMTYKNPENAQMHPGQPVEIAYADGTEEEFYPRLNHVRRYHGIGGQRAPAARPLGTDPIATLRAMLSRGALRDAGTMTLAGREVRRLVGTRTLHPPKSKPIASPVEYDVDPTTFAPVRARIGLPVPGDQAGRPTVVLDFRRFERLPLTPESAALLKIHPRPGASVTEIGRGR
jgi:hypothetical protein